MLRAAGLLLVLTTFVPSFVGCATTPAAKAASGKAVDYLPLAVGNRATWRVVPGPPEPQEVVVVSQDDRGFFVDNHGFALALRSDGVFDGQRFVLQDPLVVDHSWSAVPKGQPPESYKISATDVTVTTGAGTFTDCVVVDGEQTSVDPVTQQVGKLLITWTYARGVGLVKVEQRMVLGGEPPVTGVTMELLSFVAGSR